MFPASSRRAAKVQHEGGRNPRAGENQKHTLRPKGDKVRLLRGGDIEPHPGPPKNSAVTRKRIFWEGYRGLFPATRAALRRYGEDILCICIDIKPQHQLEAEWLQYARR